MKYDRILFPRAAAFVGMACLLLWSAAADAYTQQECTDWKNLAVLAFNDFSGTSGKVLTRKNARSMLALRKPAPGFSSCVLFVPETLGKDDPSLLCDVMKSSGVAPMEGVQTPERMKKWRSAVSSVVGEMAQCFGIKPPGPAPLKAKEGYEEEQWALRVSHPERPNSGYALLTWHLAQPKAGAHFSESSQVGANLYVQRVIPENLLASFPTEPPSAIKIEDFIQFAGLRRGDGLDALKKIYGEPIYMEASKDQKTHYYDYGRRSEGFRVSVDVENGRVGWINLYDSDLPHWLRRHGVNDSKVNLLGLHRDEVIARLGKPNRVSSDHYYWERKNQDGLLVLRILCLEAHKHQCSEMTIGWF